MPWIKISAATITFCGEADVVAALDAPPELLKNLYHGVAGDREKMASFSLIGVTPVRESLTYGIGDSMLDMREPLRARMQVPVCV